MNYETLEDAFYFVSSASPGEHVAVLSLKRRELFFASDILGHDGLPAELEGEEYLDIPHKMELLPGWALVTRFVSMSCPQEMPRVEGILARPGGQSGYKRFLQERGLLEEWYRFEIERVREALLDWCTERGIDLTPLF